MLIWWITLVNFQILNPSCITKINPIWSQYLILFLHCQIWFSNVFLMIFFISKFMRYFGMQFAFFSFLFWCCLFLVLIPWVILVSWNELGSVAICYVLWKDLCKISVNYSLNVWWNSLVQPSEHGVFFYRFNFINGYRTICVIYFILVEF